MDVTYFSNEFPQADLQDVFRLLHNHSKDRRHPFLAQFISETTLAVKEEIQKLPTKLNELFPPFSDLFEWVEHTELREGLLCGAVDGVLLVLAQLALYICHVENIATKQHEPSSTRLTALGVGLLSAAALASSSHVAELPSRGAEAVRIAFRMGIHVQGVSHQLEPRDLSDPSSTWAYVVHNVDPKKAQAELDVLHASAAAPPTGRIFISAISRTSVTISGPPSRLKGIFQRSKLFRDATSIALPVFGGLCHAPHIYGLQDVKTIVQHDKQATTRETGVAALGQLHSTSTGAPYHVSDDGDLFGCVVNELLTKSIEWDKVVANLVDTFGAEEVPSVTLSCFGNSVPLRDLQRALQESKIETSFTNYLESLTEHAQEHSGPRGTAQAKLAIVGMSCRLPGATDLEQFWNILEEGRDMSRRIPADRFDIDTHYDPEGKDMNKSMTQYGCFIDEPGLFDASFFNMSPREAMAVDPQMRLSLVTAYEALEQAGVVVNRTPSTKAQRIGTYYGQAADDYREVNQGQEVGTYYIPGGCRAFGPGRINYFFKFSGPSYSIDTACSSGIAAIEVACQALWNGDVDTAVAGGVNILTNPDGFTGLCKGHFLTKTHNACKTWDATADGYCRADGVGSVVIKKLDDALIDNDNILGVILAAGTNHSAEAVSITHPHAGHQSYLARQVLRSAGVNPLDVSYVELHGTGTQAGDYEEMQGVLDVYAPNTSPRRRSDQQLHIGAVKANVGHGESVAGTTALIKVLLMLQKSAIPPHIGIKTEINPRFAKDFDKRNVHIPFSQQEWVRSAGRKRLAAVNNFGAAGGNTMILLEEGPSRQQSAEDDSRPSHVISVSAKSKKALLGNIQRLIAFLDNADPTVRLADFAYTTTARRHPHGFRVAASVADIAGAKKYLTATMEKVDTLSAVGRSGPPSLAFAFTGQGASHQSMSLELYRDVPSFRRHIQHLDAIAQAQGFPSFIPALDGSHHQDHVHQPVVTQLTLLCVEIALAEYWASLGIIPDLVIGHSLGEYAAMQVAGVISANDAIFMVGRRAEMLQEKCQVGSHCMMAVRASLAAIGDAAANKPFTVACINGPSDTVLSGTIEQMEDITVTLEAAGFRCIKLPVAFAFHSEQTDPILDDFEAACKTGVLFHEPKLPIVSPLLGKVVFDGRTLSAQYVRRATREPVDFVSALETAHSVSSITDDTIWLEIGPHPVCANFIKSTLPSTQLALSSIRRGENNWKTLSDTMAKLHLAGVELDWNEFHSPFAGELRLLSLPSYAWDEKRYWLQYNGDWCLTKGNTYYDNKSDKKLMEKSYTSPSYESLSSLVQRIIEVDIVDKAGLVVMQSDLMQRDFLAAAHGHRMNDCGVVTSSIHADIAYTLGDYLYRKFFPQAKAVDMNMADLVVTSGLIAHKGPKSVPQLIQVTAHTEDIDTGVVDLIWQNVENDGSAGEPFATAKLIFGDSQEWMTSWSPMAHLVTHRIEMLEQMAATGQANRLSRNMAYTLFANNLVDYAEKYRGMQSVVIDGLEAFAEVQLSTKDDGAKFTVPPYFIDSVAHLAGFIMNCSDSIDTQKNYCVTSGWKSMRFAQKLVPGARYRSYVKMIPTATDSTVFLGDVFIMSAEDNQIIGMVGGIHFRQFPRILLSRFFTAPEVPKGLAEPAKASTTKTAPKEAHKSIVVDRRPKKIIADNTNPVPISAPKAHDVFDAATTNITITPALSASTVASSEGIATPPPSQALPSGALSVAEKALMLIAQETALDVSDLEDAAQFSDLGIDSLMSLVLTEKLRSDLNVKVNGSLFLDYPTIGDLRKWMVEYYD